MPLWLIGMMGAGKTEVGARLAARLGCPFIDIDHLVEAETGSPVAEIFDTEGEDGFRRREAAAIARAAAQPDAVVATGGGAVILPGNVELMRATGPVIWLQADPEVLAGRIGEDRDARPLLSGEPEARLGALLAERLLAYQGAADHVVVTDRIDPDQVVRLVEDLWNAS
ncbi:MAG TPA: shikimate kinase [Acidimicrobiia bacterium]